MKTDPDKSLAQNVVDIIKIRMLRRPKQWEVDLYRQAQQELEREDSDRTDKPG